MKLNVSIQKMTTLPYPDGVSHFTRMNFVSDGMQLEELAESISSEVKRHPRAIEGSISVVRPVTFTIDNDSIKKDCRFVSEMDFAKTNVFTGEPETSSISRDILFVGHLHSIKVTRRYVPAYEDELFFVSFIVDKMIDREQDSDLSYFVKRKKGKQLLHYIFETKLIDGDWGEGYDESDEKEENDD